MNHKLDLDYIERPTFALGQFNLLALIMCLIGFALTYIAFEQYQKENAEYKQLALQLERTQSYVSKRAAVKTAIIEEISEAELKKIRETVSDLSTPWQSLLGGLETIQAPDIALLNMQPNKKKQHVTLTGQAKNIQIMLEYVQAVSSLKMLSNVYLQNHVIDVNDPNKPVNFTIVANWK